MSSPLKLRKTSYFHWAAEEELGKVDESVSMSIKPLEKIDLHEKILKTKKTNNNQLEI